MHRGRVLAGDGRLFIECTSGGNLPDERSDGWMEALIRRTWIDIDLDKLIANYRTACGMTKAKVTCVIKSNAYGHGAVRVAQALNEAGCSSFAVSCAREAFELRKNGVNDEILVMGLTEPEALQRCIQEEITLTAGSVDDLLAIEDAARAEKHTADVQLKIDTGFHRLGFECTEESARSIAACAAKLKHVCLTGMFSHLGLINQERDRMQHDNLMRMHFDLAQQGLVMEDIHICDSIGLVRYPDWHHTRVRVGALLFGVRPYHSEHMPFEDFETLAFRTTVARVHEVKAGEIVGYGDDMILDYDAKIATLCAGYGDGYPRCLSNGKGKVMIRGQLAPVVGLVCMDQMMVDVTNIPGVARGDAVDLLGGGISYGEYAAWADTNRNECISILSRRPMRVYHQGGKVVTVLDSLLEERKDFA